MLFNIKGGFGRSGEITEESFRCNGGYRFWRDENTGNWELAFLTSGEVTFDVDPGLVDVFAVGPGENGENGKTFGLRNVYGGDGGHGGEIVNSTATLNANVIYPIDIGNPGGITSAFGITALSGIGSPEIGVGGHMLNNAQEKREPSAGNNGVRAFNGAGSAIYDFSSMLFGATGGGGRCAAIVNNGVVYPTSGGSIKGGKTGAGDGGGIQEAGKPSMPNTGSGGGGGGCYGETGYPGGAGATGIVMIRNHRG